MRISVVFITKRPGGLDILLNTLSQQTYKNYELIVVDDYHKDGGNTDTFNIRRELVTAKAQELGVELAYYGQSIRHTYHNPKYRINAALNDGLLFIKNKYKNTDYSDNIVVFFHDYIWLNHRSLEIVNQMYSRTKDTNFITAFPEVFIKVPDEAFAINAKLSTTSETDNTTDLSDESNTSETSSTDTSDVNNTATSSEADNLYTIFKEPLKSSPAVLKWPIIKDIQPCPVPAKEVFDILNFTKFNNSPITNSISVECDFWEHYFSAIPFNLIKKVNGFDERLDAGPNSITTEKYNTLMDHEKEDYDSREPQGFNDYGEKSVWRMCQHKLNSKVILVISLPVLKLDNTQFPLIKYANSSDDDSINRSASEGEWLWKRNPKDTGMQYGASILQNRLNNNIISAPNNFEL